MVPPPVRTWFLTYPQTDVTKEDALTALQALDVMQEYIVAAEKHADGGNHLHVYAKYETGFRVRDAPLTFNIIGLGDYQPARSCKAVVKYCTKDGDYLTNINLESYLKKKGKVTVDTLRTKNTIQALQDGDINFMQVRAYKLARFEVQEPYTPPGIRGVWIWGKAGIGKTRAVREKHPDLYYKAQNKWWDGYDGQKVVLLDDFDKKGECLSHYLKIWADRYACTGEIKNGNTQLSHDMFYITSNYEIEDIFGGDVELVRAIKRRFRVVHMVYPEQDLDAPSYFPLFSPMDSGIAN